MRPQEVVLRSLAVGPPPEVGLGLLLALSRTFGVHDYLTFIRFSLHMVYHFVARWHDIFELQTNLMDQILEVSKALSTASHCQQARSVRGSRQNPLAR